MDRLIVKESDIKKTLNTKNLIFAIGYIEDETTALLYSNGYYIKKTESITEYEAVKSLMAKLAYNSKVDKEIGFTIDKNCSIKNNWATNTNCINITNIFKDSGATEKVIITDLIRQSEDVDYRIFLRPNIDIYTVINNDFTKVFDLKNLYARQDSPTSPVIFNDADGEKIGFILPIKLKDGTERYKITEL